MSPNLLSPAEHKILVGISFLLLILMIGSISAKCIESYNYSVEQAQKLKRGNDYQGAIEFSACGMQRGLTFYEIILQFQILIIPFIIFNLWRREKFRFSNFLAAFCLSAINLFYYFAWIYGSYVGRMHNESFRYGADNLHGYLMIQSNIFEFSVFIGFTLLFIAQAVFLLRFSLEKPSTKPLS